MAPPTWAPHCRASAAAVPRKRFFGKVRQARRLAEQARLLSVAALQCSHALLAVGAAATRRRQHRRRMSKPIARVIGPVESTRRGVTDVIAQNSDAALDQQMPIDAKAADASVAGICVHHVASQAEFSSDNTAVSEDSTRCLGPDDFLTLAFSAGLRGDDEMWMEDFDRLGGNLGDEKVSSEIFVTLIMDDLARHCQQTRDSLQDMLKLTRGSNANQNEAVADTTPSSVRCSKMLEYDYSNLKADQLTEDPLPQVHGDLPWQSLAMEQLSTDRWAQEDDEDQMSVCSRSSDSPRLSVWTQKKDVKAAKVLQKAHRRARKKKPIDAHEPVRFDPIPEVSLDAKLEETDWCSALQDVFIT